MINGLKQNQQRVVWPLIGYAALIPAVWAAMLFLWWEGAVAVGLVAASLTCLKASADLCYQAWSVRPWYDDPHYDCDWEEAE